MGWLKSGALLRQKQMSSMQTGSAPLEMETLWWKERKRRSRNFGGLCVTFICVSLSHQFETVPAGSQLVRELFRGVSPAVQRGDSEVKHIYLFDLMIKCLPFFLM